MSPAERYVNIIKHLPYYVKNWDRSPDHSWDYDIEEALVMRSGLRLDDLTEEVLATDIVVKEHADWIGLNTGINVEEVLAGKDLRTYTLEQIKVAFQKKFYACGEIWFPPRHMDTDGVDNAQESVDWHWEEFLRLLQPDSLDKK